MVFVRLSASIYFIYLFLFYSILFFWLFLIFIYSFLKKRIHLQCHPTDIFLKRKKRKSDITAILACRYNVTSRRHIFLFLYSVNYSPPPSLSLSLFIYIYISFSAHFMSLFFSYYFPLNFLVHLRFFPLDIFYFLSSVFN